MPSLNKINHCKIQYLKIELHSFRLRKERFCREDGTCCLEYNHPSSTGVTIAATSAWGLVKETAAAVSVVTIWRKAPAWSTPSAKMVSCQLSHRQDGLTVFILYLLHSLTHAVAVVTPSQK